METTIRLTYGPYRGEVITLSSDAEITLKEAMSALNKEYGISSEGTNVQLNGERVSTSDSAVIKSGDSITVTKASGDKG